MKETKLTDIWYYSNITIPKRADERVGVVIAEILIIELGRNLHTSSGDRRMKNTNSTQDYNILKMYYFDWSPINVLLEIKKNEKTFGSIPKQLWQNIVWNVKNIEDKDENPIIKKEWMMKGWG